MNFLEALKEMDNGKSVRCELWSDKDVRIGMNSNGKIIRKDNIDIDYNLSLLDGEQVWEIYEECEDYYYNPEKFEYEKSVIECLDDVYSYFNSKGYGLIGGSLDTVYDISVISINTHTKISCNDYLQFQNLLSFPSLSCTEFKFFFKNTEEYDPMEIDE